MHNIENLNGLDLLSSAVIILDRTRHIQYVNSAAEGMLGFSLKVLKNQRLKQLFLNGEELDSICRDVWMHETVEIGRDIVLHRLAKRPLTVHAVVKAFDAPFNGLLIEMRGNVQRIRQDKESHLVNQNQANMEMVRNLAHEIKNPLGGIKGAAQLLELEVPEAHRKSLMEYTQVIIKETDRLQNLVDRMLIPHKRVHIVDDINIHEVTEQVRSIVLAEFPKGLEIRRDYDPSLPEVTANKEQLIQAVLNIAENAAHALIPQMEKGEARLTFKTRVARRVGIAGIHYKLALSLSIIDNGPGIPADLMETIFFPLISGKEGGSGLGLPLSQTLIQKHGGLIECDSVPGRTEFLIRLPLSKYK